MAVRWAPLDFYTFKCSLGNEMDCISKLTACFVNDLVTIHEIQVLHDTRNPKILNTRKFVNHKRLHFYRENIHFLYFTIKAPAIKTVTVYQRELRFTSSISLTARCCESHWCHEQDFKSPKSSAHIFSLLNLDKPTTDVTLKQPPSRLKTS